MAKLQSSLKNMILSLLLISLVLSAALSAVYTVTKKPISIAQQKKVNDAIALVVPAFDNDPVKEMYKVDGIELFPAKKEGKLVGTAIKSFSDRAFSGNISIMVGLLPDGSIKNISILEQKETPGLGTKMAEPKFKDQFNTKNPESFNLKVKKDGGNVDAITAATISSRAFCDATQKAYDAYKKGGKNE